MIPTVYSRTIDAALRNKHLPDFIRNILIKKEPKSFPES